MKVKTAIGLVLVVLMCFGQGYSAPRVFYSNSFDSLESMNDLILYGDDFPDYSGPPLHEARIESGQLVIETDSISPNGPGTNPTLSGRAALMIDTDATGDIGVYRPILNQNTDVVTWSFNISNQDGYFNTSFSFVLLSTEEDPFNLNAKGYYFRGGGMVGNRMGLWRFDFGLGGGQDVLIDVVNGLGTLPDRGSFKITYNPSNNEWALYGELAQEYVEPPTVSTFLGSAIDSTYTSIEAPYIGVCGKTTGTIYFDNILITVEDILPPTIVSTNPENLTSNVPIDSPITVRFSEPLDPATISESSFLVSDGLNNIDGTVSFSEATAVFTPTDDLTSSTDYTVSITDEVEDLVGNALQSVYTFSFRSVEDIIPPTVVSTNPENQTSNVQVDSPIMVIFSEPMDPATISTSSFFVSDGLNDIDGTVSCSETTAVFTPTDELTSSTTYTVSVTDEATDLVGNALQSAYTFSFSTTASSSGGSKGGSNDGSNGGCFVSTVIGRAK